MSSTPRITDFGDAQIARLLEEQFRGVDVASVAWLASGSWSDCFEFSRDGRQFVIRVGTNLEDFEKDSLAYRRASSQVPVPAVHLVGRADNDNHFAISDRVHGVPLESAPWSQVMPAIADLLKCLQNVDVHAFTGWGRWNSDMLAPAASWRQFLLAVSQDPVDHRIAGWRQRLSESPTGQAEFERWYAVLDRLATDDVPRSLVHNDLFNKNAHVVDGVVSGVFDWGNSMIGDPLYDVALLQFWEPWFVEANPELSATALLIEIERRSGAVAEQRMHACHVHIGLEHIAYHAWRGDFAEVDNVTRRIADLVSR